MTTVTQHESYEEDLGCRIVITEQISPGPRRVINTEVFWDDGATPDKAEAAARAQEIENGLRATMRGWDEKRIVSLLIRYIGWLVLNVPAARPPAGRLRDELQRLRELIQDRP